MADNLIELKERRNFAQALTIHASRLLPDTVFKRLARVTVYENADLILVENRGVAPANFASYCRLAIAHEFLDKPVVRIPFRPPATNFYESAVRKLLRPTYLGHWNLVAALLLQLDQVNYDFDCLFLALSSSQEARDTAKLTARNIEAHSKQSEA